MPGDPHPPSASPLAWDEDGLPRSSLYGDVYFSAEGGLAESRAVFLAGCGLPDAWKGRRRFTVGELGFGTGLNVAALLDLWRATAEPDARLHIFSVEAHPITRGEAERALARWPEIGEAAQALTERWPGRARGVHRVELPAFNAILDLAVMEAGEALASWSGRADAWFLDGFSPASNPAMWREELLALVADRSAPGARAATFTVAGAVRRGLEAAGFAVEKRPGFGRKRERLEAQAPGAPLADPPTPRVAIVGAGIAGASLARAFRALGVEPMLFGAPDGASCNPAALVTPRLDAGLGGPARLYSESFRRAVRLFADVPEVVIARGARQLETSPRDEGRFAVIAASDLFEPGSMTAQPGALAMAQALVVDPGVLLDDWSPPPIAAVVDRIEGGSLHADGEVYEADVICLAAGHASAGFADLPLQPIRGQASWVGGVSVEASAFGGYAIPTREGVLFGATHDRDVTDTDIRDEDNARNLALVAKGLPDLAAELADRPLMARASIRAATPDKLPLAGAVAGVEGLYVLSGLGSRGFCTAPLLAEHVAAMALGTASPLAQDLDRLVDPARFGRDNRRLGGKPPRR
ncbi:MAG TPA: tRNA (5-methylaminomethyl-2-thiouridine)(34)-methyltransferase MnmD [Caulobacteraceae bacterium]|nr:tRNA (5-methylaminomethyl-2-thiouridine)(34)-methyltransferase MnmD [Caulobacteraceae bacterium]